MLNEAGTAGEINLKSLQKSRPRAQWPVCRIPWEDLTVNWDGEVCLCPVDFDVRWSVGNVRKNSLGDMWNNDLSRAFRQVHLKRDYSKVEKRGVICSGCNCLWQGEYDILKDYKEYICQAIVRQAKHFAGHLSSTAGGSVVKSDGRYKNLLKLMKKIEIKNV
jgi:radical SAM protein with 4Fe4S-binding SPASM domain